MRTAVVEGRAHLRTSERAVEGRGHLKMRRFLGVLILRCEGVLRLPRVLILRCEGVLRLPRVLMLEVRGRSPSLEGEDAG
jgi:hypothetical protein